MRSQGYRNPAPRTQDARRLARRRRGSRVPVPPRPAWSRVPGAAAAGAAAAGTSNARITSAVRSMPGSAQMSPLCAALNTKVHLLLLGDPVDDRRQLPVELSLDLFGECRHVLLSVLREALDVALLTLDIRLELHAGLIAQHASACSSFC